jgi:hypothetical protein
MKGQLSCVIRVWASAVHEAIIGEVRRDEMVRYCAAPRYVPWLRPGDSYCITIHMHVRVRLVYFSSYLYRRALKSYYANVPRTVQTDSDYTQYHEI